MVNLTSDDLVKHGGEPTGSADHLTDHDIAAALAEEPNLLAAAVLLTEWHGRLISRADLADRVEDSPRLQHVFQQSEAAHDERMIRRALAAAAEARRQAELRRERNRGPRCGARTRSGAPCQRKPALGRCRCPSHGGGSPVIGPGRRRG